MKIVIVEDEVTALMRLSKMLKDIDPTIEIVKDFDSIESTVEWLKGNSMPDLFFFDIHLADGPSFDIFKQVEIHKPVIFITAFDQYALEAFRVNAIDYLLKPIKKEELEKAIKKYRFWQNAMNTDYKQLAESIRQKESGKRFLIKFGQSIKVVDIEDVAYFFTRDKITFLMTNKGKKYPIDYTLEQLQSLANPVTFFRVNRQFIVNMHAIKEMHTHSKSRVRLTLSPPSNIPTIVSTDRSPVFKKWLVGKKD